MANNVCVIERDNFSNQEDNRSILIDLDGTLCKNDHRVHLAQAKEWDRFHEALCDDELNPAVLELVYAMSNHSIVLLTGRPYKHHAITRKWLSDHHIYYDALIMRADNNYIKDTEYKTKALVEYFGSQEAAVKQILFALDDRDTVVQALREFGIQCWQVKEGDY